jgi:hypothetical protein
MTKQFEKEKLFAYILCHFGTVWRMDFCSARELRAGGLGVWLECGWSVVSTAAKRGFKGCSTAFWRWFEECFDGFLGRI